jgi:hypothetical protein
MSDEFAALIAERGQPNEISEDRIPPGSGVGTQSVFSIPLLPGDIYLQAVYYGDRMDDVYWFAKIDNFWRLSCKLKLPSSVIRKDQSNL